MRQGGKQWGLFFKHPGEGCKETPYNARHLVFEEIRDPQGNLVVPERIAHQDAQNTAKAINRENRHRPRVYVGRIDRRNNNELAEK